MNRLRLRVDTILHLAPPGGGGGGDQKATYTIYYNKLYIYMYNYTDTGALMSLEEVSLLTIVIHKSTCATECT